MKRYLKFPFSKWCYGYKFHQIEHGRLLLSFFPRLLSDPEGTKVISYMSVSRIFEGNVCDNITKVLQWVQKAGKLGFWTKTLGNQNKTPRKDMTTHHPQPLFTHERMMKSKFYQWNAEITFFGNFYE